MKQVKEFNEEWVNNVVKKAIENNKNTIEIEKALGLKDVVVAEYNKEDELIGLVYSKDFTDELSKKMGGTDNENLSFVFDIIHILHENYDDEGAESLVKRGIKYLSDIATLNNKIQ